MNFLTLGKLKMVMDVNSRSFMTPWNQCKPFFMYVCSTCVPLALEELLERLRLKLL